MKTRTTWREKLEKEQEPKIVNIPPKMAKRFGTGRMLIPRPLDVDALIRSQKRQACDPRPNQKTVGKRL